MYTYEYYVYAKEYICIYVYIYIYMSECCTVRHLVSPVSEWKKITMPEQVWYWTKPTQSGIF
jgi:hypothetical protein